MNLQNRIQKLEQRREAMPHNPPKVIEVIKHYEDGHTEIEKQVLVNYPPGHYERAIQTLADALTDITGQAVTTDETREAIANE